MAVRLRGRQKVWARRSGAAANQLRQDRTGPGGDEEEAEQTFENFFQVVVEPDVNDAIADAEGRQRAGKRVVNIAGSVFEIFYTSRATFRKDHGYTEPVQGHGSSKPATQSMAPQANLNSGFDEDGKDPQLFMDDMVREHSATLRKIGFLEECGRDVSDIHLSSVMFCTSLSHLHLPGCRNVSDALLSSVAQNCRGLKVLQLKGCQHISDDTVGDIAQNCSGLTALDLHNCYQISDASVSKLAARCTAMKSLDLGGCFELGNPSIKSVGHNFRALTHVDLGGCNRVTDTSLRILTRNCNRLRWLNLKGCDASDVCIGLLSKCSGLVHLNLHGCAELTDFPILPVATNCSLLTFLDLGQCRRVTSRLAEALATTCTRLTHLNLSHCALVNDGPLRSLISKSPRLTYLNVSKGPQVTTETASQLADCCPSVTYLNLRRSVIFDDGLVRVAQQCAGLRHLDLGECVDITDEGVCSLAALKNALNHLVLRQCSQITDISIREVAAACKRLKHLDVSRCPRLSNASLTHIARECHDLAHLNLSHCTRITDGVMVALSQHCRRLTYLNIGDCREITTKAIRLFEKHGVQVLHTCQYNPKNAAVDTKLVGIKEWVHTHADGHNPLEPEPPSITHETYARLAKKGILHDPRPRRPFKYIQTRGCIELHVDVPPKTKKRHIRTVIRMMYLAVSVGDKFIIEGDLCGAIVVSQSSWGLVRDNGEWKVEIVLTKAATRKRLPWRTVFKADLKSLSEY